MRETNRRVLQARQARLNPGRPDFFVPPELVEGSEGAGQPFWLVSAPAAVGKSTLAIALANGIASTGRQALYVPLRGTTLIGQEWFGGLLAAAFHEASQAEHKEALRATQVVVLLDGYDELSMTDVQIEAHKLLADELLEYVGTEQAQRRVPSVIILFRSAIRGLGIFESLVKYAQELELKYFSPEKQVLFLSKYLERKGASVGAEAPLLTALQGALLGAKAGERKAAADVTAFLGHAPVLMTIGDLVLESQADDPNPAALVQQLRTDVARRDWGAMLLLRIIDQLVKRESTKFPLEIFTRHGLADITSLSAYGPELQEALLKCIAEANVTNDNWEEMVDLLVGEHWGRLKAKTSSLGSLGNDDQEQLGAEYAREVKEKLQHHPFLERSIRGVEFSNPLYFEKYLADVLFEQRVKPAEAFARYTRPSHYLAEFILQKFPDRDLRSRPDLLFYVIRSQLMAGGDDLGVEASLEGARWRFTVGGPDDEPEPFWYGERLLEFQVPSGQVLEGVDVDGGQEGEVILTATNVDPSSGRLALSQVSITAKYILLEAGHLLCDSTKLVGGRVVFGDYLAAIDGLQTLEVQGQLQTSEYVRRRYGDAIGLVENVGADLFRQKLSGMLTWFRKRGKSTFAIYNKRWHTAVLDKDRDELAVKIAGFLKNKHILRESAGERMVFLDEEQLAEFGIHYKKHNEISFGKAFERLADDWRQYPLKG
jgi:hypothetical protein